MSGTTRTAQQRRVIELAKGGDVTSRPTLRALAASRGLTQHVRWLWWGGEKRWHATAYLGAERMADVTAWRRCVAEAGLRAALEAMPIPKRKGQT